MTSPADPLTAARAQLTDAFAGVEVNERLLTVFQLLQQVARDELAQKLGDEFDLLLAAVASNRRATLAALIAYETALLNTVRAERRADLSDHERRLGGLEEWAYGGTLTVTTAPRVPPPGHDDPEDYTAS